MISPQERKRSLNDNRKPLERLHGLLGDVTPAFDNVVEALDILRGADAGLSQVQAL